MTSMPTGAAESWAEGWPATDDLGLDDSPSASPSYDVPNGDVHSYGSTDAHRPDSDSAAYWRDDARWHSAGYAVTQLPGVPGRGLIVLSAVAAGVCTLLDLVLTGGRLTFFFDLCFVVLCLTSTMAVRRSDIFTAGVLPPLIYAGVIAMLSVLVPDAFAAGSGTGRVFLTGLADHAGGLVSGYAVALAVVAARVATSGPARR